MLKFEPNFYALIQVSKVKADNTHTKQYTNRQ